MVTTAKQNSQDKAGREVLYFDVPEKTGIVSVIGADTALGANMVKHLSDAGKTVYGFTQEKDFKFSLRPISEHETGKIDYPPHPILSDWLVLCIDPKIGFEKYTSRIRNLSNTSICTGRNIVATFCSFHQLKSASRMKMVLRKTP